MKKKVLLSLVIASMLAFTMAIFASALEFDKSEVVEVTLSSGAVQECELYDSDGDELVWYTLDGGATLISVKTKNLYFSDEASLKSIYLEKDGTPLQLTNETTTNHIVVANLRCKAFTALVHSGYKSTFNQSKIIQYVYLPSTIKSLACNQFQSCTNLKVLDFPSDARFSFDDSNFANGCTSLKEINLTGLTGVKGGSHFSGCSSLSKIIGLENSTTEHIGWSMFKEAAIEELRLPNTLKTIGNAAFASCKSLKVVYLGNSLATFEINDKFKASDAFNTTAIEYVYMPASVTAVPGYTFLNSNNLRVIFYAGTKEQAIAMYNASTMTNNAPFQNLGKSEEQFISYEEYCALPNDDNGKYIVYNYSACNAFYNGEHIDVTTYDFIGDAFVSSYCRFDTCDRCIKNDITDYGMLLVNKGYSAENDGNGFSLGIIFNKDVIAIYEEKSNNSFNYGFVVGKITDGDEGKIVNANGEKATDNVIATLFTETEYNLFNVKITGVDTDANKAKQIYMSAFIIDGEHVSYIGDNVTKMAVPVSYDAILTFNDVTEDE